MKQSIKIISTLILFLFIVVDGFGESVTNVPIDDEISRTLNRFEVKGYLSESLGNCYPLSRRQAVAAIAEVMTKEKSGEIQLTDLEKALLRELIRDFYWELRKEGFELEDSEPERHIYRWTQGENEANFDLIGSLKGIYKNGDSYSEAEKTLQTTLGGILRGAIWEDKLGVYAKSTNTREEGTKSYSEGEQADGEYIDYEGDYAYFDRTDAYIIFRFPWVKQPNDFVLELGKESIKWGPGYRGNLAISDNPETYNLIKIQGKYGKLRFVSFTGFLKSDLKDTLKSYYVTEETERDLEKTKYIAGHRFELSLVDGVDLAVEEIAVYGERDLDIGYLNPVMFYRSYEHNNDGMDNMAIGADFSLRLIPKTEIYGEFFIDDWYLAKITSDWWGNKLGYLGGIYWIEPFAIQNAALRFEFAQIEPWVYTHIYPINTYTHNSEILGHWLGPNSRYYYGESNYMFSERLDFRLYSEFIQHGDDEHGGDVFAVHEYGVHGDDSHILSGVVEEILGIGMRVHYEAIPDFSNITFSGKWLRKKNAGHAKSDAVSDIDLNLFLEFNW